MVAKFTAPVLAITFLVPGTIVLNTLAKTTPPALTSTKTLAVAPSLSTIFRCIKYNSGFATIAQRGDRTTPPVITWNATLGSDYTPQKRCNQVSAKLTQAVAENGGTLHNLVLTPGTVNHQKVICLINSSIEAGCNSTNLLFTLRPENAARAGEVVARLHNFSTMGTGTPVQELAGGIPQSLFGVEEESLPLERLNRFLQPQTNTIPF